MRNGIYIALLALLTGGLVAGVSIFSDSHSNPPARGSEQVRNSAGPRDDYSQPAPGTAARFAYLTAQRSNSCGLQAQQLSSYTDSARLQGSCCFPMDPQTYAGQIRGLRKYRHIRDIPRDPYDIPASLAKRLVRYQKGIVLSSAQRATYKGAMRMSDEKGPCCCPCWRWDAFQGMSNYLIARRGFEARELAHVIDLVEGCGGPKAHNALS